MFLKFYLCPHSWPGSLWVFPLQWFFTVLLDYLDLWFAFDCLELIAFLIQVQIPYLKSFQTDYILLLFFNSLKAITFTFSVSTHS